MLNDAKRRCLQRTLRYFRRHGAELDEVGKERLGQIDAELTELTMRFSQNVVDSTDAFKLIIEDEKMLAGLPAHAKAAASAKAKSKGMGGWCFTLHGHSFIPALTHLKSSKIREKLYRAMTTRATRGSCDNRPILSKILLLRAERAHLLGYASFGELVAEDRMMGSSACALQFVEDLTKRTAPLFAREGRELASFRRKQGDDTEIVLPWDLPYLVEKQRKLVCGFDAEALRSYFSFERVLEGIFSIAMHLFAIDIEPWPEAPKWHDTVRAYKIVDKNAWVAGFYIDAFQREHKHGGAWMNGILHRAHSDNDIRKIAILIANVTPPIDKQEALLSFIDVETLFHEFGHLIHHCLSDTELRAQAGMQVAWDFVELPSQIFQNWCWERESLDLFAKQYKTHETIPKELFDAMKRARAFRSATNQMRQLGFAALDLMLHTEFNANKTDPMDYACRLLTNYLPEELTDDYAALASFDHLFGDTFGYAGCYYSYKWAEVLDADAFTRFRQEGILSRDVGLSFRRCILERGDEEDPATLFRSFMGREPDVRALLNRIGKTYG